MRYRQGNHLRAHQCDRLFEFKDALFSIGPLDFTRTVILIFLAMFIVLALLFFAFRKPKIVPASSEW